MSDPYNAFNVKRISRFIVNYSIKDIAESLFASSLWVPNLACQMRHLVLVVVFISTSPLKFAQKDMINDYNDFKKFIKGLRKLVPKFPTIDDYIPELDWGEVRFNIKGNNFKIFYGCEIENVYDYLEQFNIFFWPYNDKIKKICKREPIKELYNIVKIQDNIISSINNQKKIDSPYDEINIGEMDIPDVEFWNDCLNYLSKKSYKNYEPNFVNDFSIKIGALSEEIFKEELIFNKLFNGKIINHLYISNNEKYYPILPRRYSMALLEQWEQIWIKQSDVIIEDPHIYDVNIGWSLNNYISSRVKCQELFPFVSAVTSEDAPHELVFSLGIISKDQLYLVYTLEPWLPGENLTKRLDELTLKFSEVLSLLSFTTPKLALKSEGKIAVFENDDVKLNPKIFVLIPKLSPSIEFFNLPESFNGIPIFLDKFLALFDEIDHIYNFTSFFDYLEEYGNIRGILSIFDKYASYKLSHGVLIEGAQKVDVLLLDPHMGSNFRYDSLTKFWKLFPEKGLYGHPRSWTVEKETESTVRLTSRTRKEMILTSIINQTRLFISAPFPELENEEIEMSNFLMECLNDSLQKNKLIIGSHRIFNSESELFILVFPANLVMRNSSFNHLNHLINENPINLDFGHPKDNMPGVRLVFDLEKIIALFSKVEDSTQEIKLLSDVLELLNRHYYDNNFSKMKELLFLQKDNPPRYMVHNIDRHVAFPQYTTYYEIEPTYYKSARKKIAEIGMKLGITPGQYELNLAKVLINKLREKVVNEIDDLVGQYDFNQSIPLLITQIDSLINDYDRQSTIIERSLEHQVDYKREEKLADEHLNFILMHKNTRYLVEKFVQISPKSDLIFTIESYKELMGYVDWLHVLYHASDSLHYEIFPLGINISEDYTIEVDYEPHFKDKQEIYAREQAEINLGIIGNPNDRVESPSILTYLDELDEAFKKDKKFHLKDMINVLHVLSLWGVHKKGEKIKTYYMSNIETITTICKEHIIGFNENDIYAIVDYLTLKQNDVTKLLGQKEICDDVPIWESKKRFSRYTLKPLIKYEDKYIWGPFSAYKTSQMWINTLSDNVAIIDFESDNIKNAIDKEKSSIEKLLEVKAEEIIKRYTNFVYKNLELHKFDKMGNHPAEVGEYDILAYSEKLNLVLNIECKDISPAFCLKDAQRIRRTIFGTKPNTGYLSKLLRRQSYLRDNILSIAKKSKWPLENNDTLKIVPIMLTRRSYWWTKYPPIKTSVVFLRVDNLDHFINNFEK